MLWRLAHTEKTEGLRVVVGTVRYRENRGNRELSWGLLDTEKTEGLRVVVETVRYRENRRH